MALSIPPELTFDELYANAHRFYTNGCYKDAEQIFRLLNTLAPLSVPIWMGLAGSLQMQKKYSEAVDTYGTAALLEESDSDPFPHARAAECLFSLGDMKRAMVALKSAQHIAQKDKKYDALLEQLKLLEERWKDGNRIN